jgi:hypothetical protein
MNNNLYYNAAIVGFVEGALSARDLTQENVAADYASLYTAAVSFAASVDTAIPGDTLVSVSTSNPAALSPTSSTIQNDQVTRSALVRSLAAAAVSGRYNVTNTAAFYVGIAASVAAAFLEAAPAGTAGTIFVVP